MNYRSILALALLLSASRPTETAAQIVTFNTSGLTATQSTQSTFSATQTDPGVSGIPQLSRTTLTPGGGAANCFFSTGANITNTLNLSTNYVGFSVAASSSNALFATAINWTSQGSNTAPNSYATAYSTDNFTTSVVQTFTNTTSTTAQTRNFSITNLITNDTLSVRFYNYGSTSINGGTSSTGGSFRTITPSVQGGTFNTTSGSVALSAPTEIRSSTSLSIGGTVSGNSTLAINGNVTLSAANTYTGNTTVNSGTLTVSNAAGSATGTGSVQVNSGATLASGNLATISGNVTLASGATLSPGGSGATAALNLGGNLTVNGGATLALDLSGSAGSFTSDLLTLNSASGVLNFVGSSSNPILINLNAVGLTLPTSGNSTFTIAQVGTTGNIQTNGTTFDPSIFSISSSNITAIGYSLSVSGSTLQLTVTTPEPGAVLLLCAGAAGLVQTVRRRRKAAAEQPLAV